MKHAKTILFAVLALTAVYSATKVHGTYSPLFPTDDYKRDFAVCVTCGKPSQVSTKAFPVRQKENIKLLEERLNALYPKP